MPGQQSPAGSASTVAAPAFSPRLALCVLFAGELRHKIHAVPVSPTGTISSLAVACKWTVFAHHQSNEPRWVGPGDVFLPSLGVP